MSKLIVGDRVAYSIQFLKSIGMSHSDMAHARGEISFLQKVGERLVLAVIKWNCEMPQKVNVMNLAKVSPNRKFCNID